MDRRLLLSVAVVAVALLERRGAVGYPWSTCGEEVGFPANSDYMASLSVLAATMPKNASMSPGLFATAQAGVDPEKVWALAFCRGDANASYCSNCLDQGFQDLISSCVYKDATIYYDSCLVYYSNIDFFHAADDIKYSGILPIRNLRNATADPAGFQRVVAVLVNATASSAAFNSSPTRLYASGQADFDKELPEVYSWAQCTPDISPDRCWRCLVRLMRYLPTYFTDATGARVLGVRCSIRYETQRFFNGSVTVQLPAASASSPASAIVPKGVTSVAAVGEAKKKTSAAGISVGIVCSLVLFFSVFVFIRFRRRIKAATEHDNPFKKISRAQCVIFDLPTLEEATENFSERNKLGQGGFGAVYKGILPDGQEIAVKKLVGTAGHGLHQLHNEVLLLAELQHKNLVRLQGFYSHRDDTLLVYEYIKNGSLDNFLSDTREGDALIWDQRYNIILGIAKGILYLHEDSSMRIIHRDLKPNNILLDEDMEPKIADFGLARLLGEGHTHTKTSGAAGTPGYMAPEYVYHGRVSPKIDIFSYGVLILQIVTRRRKCWSDDSNAVNLLTEVWNHWKRGTMSQMIDQTIDEHSRYQQLRCVHVGLMCVQADPGYRPEISTVIFILTRDNMELQPPEEPAFLFGSSTHWRHLHSSSGASANSNFVLGEEISVNGVTITEPYPR